MYRGTKAWDDSGLGRAGLPHPRVENRFRYNWCRTRGTFYLVYVRHRAVIKTRTPQQETYVAKAEAHKCLLWARNKGTIE